MSERVAPGLLRLTLARACAWALLVAGWIGIGCLALRLASSPAAGFALVALWLLALGAAATVATRGGLRRTARAVALGLGAATAAGGLLFAVHGEGLPALIVAILGWSALTALASGVVRALRQAQAVAPGPPIGAASLGALGAALVLGDLGDFAQLATRLALLVVVIVTGLIALQRRIDASPAASGCRAGLFDCSLPAWPQGAWRDPLQWPILLAGLAMLPMMAALPLMADWCRAQALPAQGMVMLHLGAMFGPALVLRRVIGHWSSAQLSLACGALLIAGAAAALWAPPPYGWFTLAGAHGAAWGLAWGGQLWAPARRGQRGASPLRAGFGYAAVTLLIGLLVDQIGARALADLHAAIGGAALLGLLGWASGAFRRSAELRRDGTS